MTAPKKILFISYDGMTDPLGQSQVIPYLQGLREAGYEIFLMSCEKKEAWQQHREGITTLLQKSGIHWIPLRYTKKPPVISTLLDIIKMRRAARKLHKEQGIDLVHTRAGVPTLVGLWLKKTRGIKFLNDIREFYADSRVEGGMWNKRTPIYRAVYHYFLQKESEAVIASDGIVCLTYAAQNIIRDWPEYDEKIPIEVIPCSADLALFDAATISDETKARLRTELEIHKNDFLISYLGSIGGWYLTDEMMRLCKKISDWMPAARFLFISPHRHSDIRAAARAYQIPENKILIKKASRLEVPALLSLSSYSMFFIKPCYSKQSSSPTKHGEIMAMGIPVITNSGVGDVAGIVQSCQSGIVIDEFTNEAFDGVVNEMINNRDYDSKSIREGAAKYYSLEQAVEKYRKIYGQILN